MGSDILMPTDGNDNLYMSSRDSIPTPVHSEHLIRGKNNKPDIKIHYTPLSKSPKYHNPPEFNFHMMQQ